MLTAFSDSNPSCYAWVSQKSEGPFYCKKCNIEVILKKGLIKQHHFAHKPPKQCMFGYGESDIHYKAKKGIFEGLLAHANCTYCELEKPIGDVIPDVFAIINGVNVAIEVQKSKMTVEEAIRRTKACHKNGLSVIWIIPNMDELKIYTDEGESVCKAAKWKIFFHALGMGKLYVWAEHEAFVKVVHLSEFKRYVQESSYYDSYGDEVTHGGYHKALKTVKTVELAPFGEINLADNFRASFRSEEFKTTNWSIPVCSTWADDKGFWWKQQRPKHRRDNLDFASDNWDF